MAIEQIFLTSRLAFNGIPLPTDALFFSPFAESQSTLEVINKLQSYYDPIGAGAGAPVINQNGFFSGVGEIISIPTSDSFIDLDHGFEGNSGTISTVGTKFENNGAGLVGSYFIRSGQIIANITAADAVSITVDAPVLASDLLDMSAAAADPGAQKLYRRDIGDELFVNGYSFTRSSYVTIPEISFPGDFGGSAEVNRRDVGVSMTVIGHSTGSDRIYVGPSGQIFANINGSIVASSGNVIDPSVDYELDWSRTASTFVLNANGVEVINDTVNTGSVAFDRISRSATDSDSFRGRISEVKFLNGVTLSRNYPIKDGAGTGSIIDVVGGQDGSQVSFYAGSWIDNWNDQPVINFYREIKFQVTSSGALDSITAGAFGKNILTPDDELFFVQGSIDAGFKSGYRITNDSIDYGITLSFGDVTYGELITVKIFVSEADGIFGLLERDGKLPVSDQISASAEMPNANQELSGLILADDSGSMTIQSNAIGGFNP